MRRTAPVVVIAALVLSACADTVVEVGGAAPAAVGSDETVPTTTLPVEGSAAELLPEMATEMSRLSSQIAADGDERATLLIIERTWDAARAEVEELRPELASGIQTTVDMARTAVTRIRPADADKAFQILSDLVDRYTGDR
ncbi:MAG TPA: hypothetical protein VK860_10905 [Ilumatobacteraceae bacterium]|nr:hypothetical protein [Ilumatobacteraceae bacterium]